MIHQCWVRYEGSSEKLEQGKLSRQSASETQTGVGNLQEQIWVLIEVSSGTEMEPTIRFLRTTK